MKEDNLFLVKKYLGLVVDEVGEKGVIQELVEAHLQTIPDFKTLVGLLNKLNKNAKTDDNYSKYRDLIETRISEVLPKNLSVIGDDDFEELINMSVQTMLFTNLKPRFLIETRMGEVIEDSIKSIEGLPRWAIKWMERNYNLSLNLKELFRKKIHSLIS